MPETTLHRFTVRVSAEERDAYAAGDTPPLSSIQEVARGAVGVRIDNLDALMLAFMDRAGASRGPRAETDSWLAPRLHATLRLTRAEASDSGVWLWLAVRYSYYLEWRWSSEGGVTEDRWNGGINKQALARLWWGAELFRDGSDYSPVERAFRRQDLINSFLHRPLVRCRSLALGIIDVVAPADGRATLSSDDVNALARVLNLATAGAPPEAEASLRRDDLARYAQWVRDDPGRLSWEPLPDGPPCDDTSTTSKEGGRAIAERARVFADVASIRSASTAS